MNQKTVNDVNFLTRILSTLFIKTMFRPVQGWSTTLPLNYEAFITTGIDGSQLEGAILRTNIEKPKGIIILCHPFLKYGMHYFYNNKLAQRLNDQGFVMVTFNFKGFGNSNIKGPSFFDDVLSINQFISTSFPKLPIHLLGCSFGGFHICHALAKNDTNISSIILDSVPLTVTSYFRHGILSVAMNWLSKSSLGRPTSTQPIKYSLPKIKDTPMMFFYGDNDPYIHKQDLEELKSSAPNTQFIQFKDCAHLDNYKKHQKQYIETAIDFINSKSKI